MGVHDLTHAQSDTLFIAGFVEMNESDINLVEDENGEVLIEEDEIFLGSNHNYYLLVDNYLQHSPSSFIFSFSPIESEGEGLELEKTLIEILADETVHKTQHGFTVFLGEGPIYEHAEYKVILLNDEGQEITSLSVMN